MARTPARPRPTLVVTDAELERRIVARLERLVAHLDAVAPERQWRDAERTGNRLPRWTADMAAAVRAEIPAIAARQRAALVATVEQLVPKPLRQAVLARESLTNRWPFLTVADVAEPVDVPLRDAAFIAVTAPIDVVQSDILATAVGWLLRPDEADVPGLIPHVVEPATRWAQAQLGRSHVHAEKLDVLLTAWRVTSARPDLVFGQDVAEACGISLDDLRAAYHNALTWWLGAVRVYEAVQDVEHSRRRPYFAVDASAPHTAMLDGFTELVRDRALVNAIDKGVIPQRLGRVELLAPGRTVQLSLDYDGNGSISDAAVDAIYDLHGRGAVRHYTALLARLTTEGRRTGRVTWSVDAHLAALGVPLERRRNERDNATRLIRSFSEIQVVVYDANNRVRVRLPLVAVVGDVDVNTDHGWELGGHVLQFMPTLYEGVRQPDGRLGRNWYPAPLELAAIDETQFPYATLLGLKLATRFRFAMHEGKAALRLSGDNLLTLAGITRTKNDPSRAWASLTRTLNKLRQVGSLENWKWTTQADTLGGVVELVAPDWTTDRTLRGVRHVERTVATIPATGRDLRQWRDRRKWSLDQAARALGVHRNTLYTAERQPDKALSARLKAKFSAI